VPDNAKKGPGAPRHGEQVKVNRSFMVEPELWRRSVEIAKRREESVSSILCRALQRYVTRHGNPET
jgi:hypothetical protein